MPPSFPRSSQTTQASSTMSSDSKSSARSTSSGPSDTVCCAHVRCVAVPSNFASSVDEAGLRYAVNTIIDLRQLTCSKPVLTIALHRAPSISRLCVSIPMTPTMTTFLSFGSISSATKVCQAHQLCWETASERNGLSEAAPRPQSWLKSPGRCRPRGSPFEVHQGIDEGFARAVCSRSVTMLFNNVFIVKLVIYRMTLYSMYHWRATGRVLFDDGQNSGELSGLRHLNGIRARKARKRLTRADRLEEDGEDGAVIRRNVDVVDSKWRIKKVRIKQYTQIKAAEYQALCITLAHSYHITSRTMPRRQSQYFLVLSSVVSGEGQKEACRPLREADCETWSLALSVSS